MIIITNTMAITMAIRKKLREPQLQHTDLARQRTK
jgi:hypothetical protein